MTPEDKELWERVVATVVPRTFQKTAASMGAPAVWIPVSEKVLDLHGLTLNAAHARALEFLREANRIGHRRVIVITGLSGEIRREFPMWIENLPYVRKSTVLSGGGAFEVLLPKQK